MKLSVNVVGSLLGGAAAHGRRVEILSRVAVQQLSLELEEELRRVAASEGAAGADAEPAARRDVLERAVRRIWGATQ
jgi:hypothetical protein